MAIQKLAVLAALEGCHWLLGKLFAATVPEGWSVQLKFLDAVAFVTFALIDVFLLLEVIDLFIPKLKDLFARRRNK